MSYPMLPPEITSAQMFAGPGSGPMLAAAASWGGLGNELGAAAESFSSVTSGLADGPWQGAAAAAMAAVAAQYGQWLSTAAAHAENVATQASAVAGMFEAAKSAVTHPVAVTANRMQLVSLVRSNLFGFNAPAIAETEAVYESMWAQNVASLTGYHGGASAVAAQLVPWDQALRALPAALSATPAAAAAAALKREPTSISQYDQQAIAALRRTNSLQIARTQELTKQDLVAARAALGGRQETKFAAASGPLAHGKEAAGYVGDVALINAGTALQVGGRTALGVPLLAGKDLDILGGAGPLSGAGPARLAEAVAGTGAVDQLQPYGGGGDLQQQAIDYNQRLSTDFQHVNAFQMSATHALTGADLSAASTAAAHGQLLPAVQDVADAGLINAGTGLQMSSRAAALAPEMAGGDLDILGGGSSLLYPYLAAKAVY